MKKKQMRLRRATRIKLKIKELDIHKISVHKTSRHMYVQLTTPDGSRTLAEASTLNKELREQLKVTSNKDAAKEVGQMIAKKAIELGITKVAFDRAGFMYHGRVKALADAARESGLIF